MSTFEKYPDLYQVSSAGAVSPPRQVASEQPDASYPACSKHIFSHAGNAEKKDEKQRIVMRIGKNTLEWKYPDCEPPEGGGVRGKITGFSRQSSKRMIVRAVNAENTPQWWQTLGFADDIMGGSLEECRDVSNRTLKLWKRWIEKEFPEIEGFWRREWERRKSGIHIGQPRPHFHVFFYLPDATVQTYRQAAVRIAELWVQASGTQEVEKSLHVNQHEKQYKWLTNRRMAVYYASKYMGKVQDDFQDGEENEKVSLGRMWGKIGQFREARYVERELDYQELVWIRRFAKRYVKSSLRHKKQKLSKRRKKSRKGKPGKRSRYRSLLHRTDELWLVVDRKTVLDWFWAAWNLTSPVPGPHRVPF